MTARRKQIKHPVVRTLGKAYYEAEKAVEAMDETQIGKLRVALASMSRTNCSYVEWAVRDLLGEIVSDTLKRRAWAADRAARADGRPR